MVFLFLCVSHAFTLLQVKALCVREKGENPSQELARAWLGCQGEVPGQRFVPAGQGLVQAGALLCWAGLWPQGCSCGCPAGRGEGMLAGAEGSLCSAGFGGGMLWETLSSSLLLLSFQGSHKLQAKAVVLPSRINPRSHIRFLTIPTPLSLPPHPKKPNPISSALSGGSGRHPEQHWKTKMVLWQSGTFIGSCFPHPHAGSSTEIFGCECPVWAPVTHWGSYVVVWKLGGNPSLVTWMGSVCRTAMLPCCGGTAVRVAGSRIWLKLIFSSGKHPWSCIIFTSKMCKWYKFFATTDGFRATGLGWNS